ncbi:MAG: serine/threonine-protein kinase [Gemmatimonadaceae bacterium]
MAANTTLVDPLFLAFQEVVAGHYSLDRELGRGGMGVVYLAREVHLDRLVAIKLLPPERARDARVRDRFLREARLAGKLSHPNIIPIHSVEERAGFVFFVMAFVDGETLEHRVRTRGPLPPSEGVRVLREVAWALAYAHEQGLVHRDIKPENILIESSSGRVLVADFGIATSAHESPTEGIAGTPAFMSPEQALGQPLDARTDLYALGATAWFMLSGRLLFESEDVTRLLARQVVESAPPLISVASGVPRRLGALIDRCLAKNPAQRPPSAHSLANELSTDLERRRELPAALRAFVKREARLNGAGTVIGLAFTLPTAIIGASQLGGRFGYSTLLLGATVLPFSYFVAAARRLLRLGFAHADLEPAFRRELEQAREELSVNRRVRVTWLERALNMSIRVAFYSGAAGLATGLLAQGALASRVGDIGALTMGVASLAALCLLALRQRHEDVDTEFWSKVWLGRVGRTAFAIASKLLGQRRRLTPVTHRPTEIAIGLAAEELYRTLPAETQRALGDVPDVLQRLQGDVRVMRQRCDEVQQALAESADATAPEHADLSAIRTRLEQQLAESVSALESVRLNLLRLHAGAATVEGFTTHLGMAVEVSTEVQRLIAAHEEVARGLKEPGVPLTTPSFQT